MHALLARQIRKTLGEDYVQQDELQALLRAVNDAYLAADEDRHQLERSLSLASEELYERNRRLEQELEERKRLELELRLAEKMRAVGQLAAGIAHEINTPVQFIGDSLWFLGEACRDLLAVVEAPRSTDPVDPDQTATLVVAPQLQIDLPFLREEVPRAISRCELGIERVTKIVRALKELAHPDGGTQEPADLNQAIENTLIVVANEIKYVADVHLDLQAAGIVRCHVGEVQQVLLNLLVNAGHAIADRVGATGARGTIRIATRDEGNDCVIDIADDGAGITVAVRDRIFEPFFTTKPVGKGSGQGLPIARAFVVEHHGGSLTFDSELGKGTTFTIRLPRAGKAAATESRAA